MYILTRSVFTNNAAANFADDVDIKNIPLNPNTIIGIQNGSTQTTPAPDGQMQYPQPSAVVPRWRRRSPP